MATRLATICIAMLPALFAAAGASARAKVYGVHEPDIANLSSAGVAAMLSDLGAKAHRWNLQWQFAEPNAPQNGVHNYKFSIFDQVYAADLARGIRPLIVLMSAPKWAWGDGVPQGDQPFGMPPGPEHLDDWAAFVGAVAKRYPQALGFEIWNEPDAWAFWGRGVVPIDPAAYTRVLARAHGAVKSVDPCAPVVGGALAAYPTTSPGVHMSVSEFVGGMLRADAANHMDAISLHDYAVGPAPPGPAQWAIPPGWVREALARNGVSVPIWITESGVSTTGLNAVTEQGQAQSLADLVRWFQAQPDLEALFTHRLVEHGVNPLERELGYGLVHQGTFAAKPAFSAIRAAASSIAQQPADLGPSLQASIPVRQRVGQRGKLKVTVRCPDCCSVRAHGKLKLRVKGAGKRRYRLHADQASLTGSGPAILELQLRRKQRRALRRSADRIRGRLRAVVTVVATNRTGATQQHRIKAKLVARHGRRVGAPRG
jgi:polysaccharide biosynthesis protein PslG